MQEEKTEGIVLRSLDFKDNQRIITAFTPLGLISLVVKGITSKRLQLLSLTSPFCESEFLFKRGRSELLSFLDGSIIDTHLFLRQQLSFLQIAGSLAQAILNSQLTGKSSFHLYQLFRFYLKAIPSFESPLSLLTSFHLKLLTHEGLLCLSLKCNRCKERDAKFLSKGESLCDAHSCEEGFHFSSEEWGHLIHLQQAKKFSELRLLALPLQLHQKISVFFKDRIAQ